jgi:hypothetical protein
LAGDLIPPAGSARPANNKDSTLIRAHRMSDGFEAI